MPLSPSVAFIPSARPESGTVVLIAGEGMKFGPNGRAIDEASAGAATLAAKIADFTAKANATLDILAPRGLALDRLILAGTGKKDPDWLKLGGAVAGKISGATNVTILLEAPEGDGPSGEQAAEFALGLLLRSYKFDRYKTRKKDENGGAAPESVRIAVRDPAAAEAAFAHLQPVAEGVTLTRDLVNEPANVLGPVELAARAEALRAYGVEVEILGEEEMRALGMRALLGVAQGSARPPRLVVMRWNGGEGDPVAFLGKGVVFDTGGVSLKPGSGMEDMKGDMAGAAAVIGAMRALAGRKARANVVGMVALVENMPDGAAQRPGDIVESMSGQTIEIINTDAEGRLILADALWHLQERYRPRLVVDLATLTGAVLVALGSEFAGLFSNDDDLAARLTAAGQATGDRVWRLPLVPEFDKLIDSKVADMKNSAGRNAGSATAAHFIQRFVKEGALWAHLDIAGVAIGSPQTEINRSWSSGFGVRLLDRFVADLLEK